MGVGSCTYALLFIAKDNDLAKYAGKSNDVKRLRRRRDSSWRAPTGAGADMYRVWLEDD